MHTSSSQVLKGNVLQVNKRFLLTHIDFGLLLVILIPLLLLLSNHEWLFPYGDATDAWLNYAFFYGYGHNHSLFFSYKASRLDWIVKGALLHRLFPPLTAYYLMCFSIFYTCTISFYYIAKNFFTRQIATISALMFSTYSQFISGISFEWDYNTHNSIANLNLALLFLVLAAKRKSYQLFLVLSGFFCACSFQSTYTVIALPALITIYLIFNHNNRNNPLLPSILYFGIGGITSVLFYCCINYFVFNGPFLFFMPELKFAAFAHDFYRYRSGYWLPLLPTILHIKGATLSMAIFLLAAVSLVLAHLRRYQDRTTPTVKASLYSAIIVFAIIFIYQCSGMPYLNFEHITVTLVTFFILAIGGFLTLFNAKQINDNKWWVMTIGGFIVLCGTLVLGHNSFHAIQWVENISIIIVALLLLWWLVTSQETIHKKIMLSLIASLFALLVILKSHHPVHQLMDYSLNFSILVKIISLSTLLLFALYFIKKLYYFSTAFIFIVFITINIYSSSIPLVLYQFNFPSTLLHDQYITILGTLNYLQKNHANLLPYLWYENEKPHYHPKGYSSKELADSYFGLNSTQPNSAYGAIHEAMYLNVFFDNNETKRSNLQLSDIKTHCPSVYQLAPSWIQGGSLLPQQNNILGGYNKTQQFATLPGKEFWLTLLPKEFSLAIMTQDNNAYQDAIASLKASGYSFRLLSQYSISEPASTIVTHVGTAKLLYDTPERQCIDRMVS